MPQGVLHFRWAMAERYLIGTSALNKKFQQLGDQVPFAVALGLTRIAQRAQNDAERGIVQRIDRPTPFTQRAVAIKTATKRRPEAVVFIKDRQGKYLKILETGGVEKPKRRALVVPVGVRLNQYGNMTKGRVKKLLARKDVFSGRINGTAGIWQRRKRKGPKLLVAYEDRRTVRPQLHFKDTVIASMRRHAVERMKSAADFAIKTAR